MNQLNIEIVPKGGKTKEMLPDDLWAFPPGEDIAEIGKVVIEEQGAMPSGLPAIQINIKLSNGKYVYIKTTGRLIASLAQICEGVANKSGKSLMSNS